MENTRACTKLCHGRGPRPVLYFNTHGHFHPMANQEEGAPPSSRPDCPSISMEIPFMVRGRARGLGGVSVY